MIAVAVASEQLLSRLEEKPRAPAKLADPRTINMDEAEADRLVAASFPSITSPARFTHLKPVRRRR